MEEDGEDMTLKKSLFSVWDDAPFSASKTFPRLCLKKASLLQHLTRIIRKMGMLSKNIAIVAPLLTEWVTMSLGEKPNLSSPISSASCLKIFSMSSPEMSLEEPSSQQVQFGVSSVFFVSTHDFVAIDAKHLFWFSNGSEVDSWADLSHFTLLFCFFFFENYTCRMCIVNCQDPLMDSAPAIAKKNVPKIDVCCNLRTRGR